MKKEKEMKNGLIGTHIATGIPVELNLNAKEMQLAMTKENINECWELMNNAVFKRTGVKVIGEVEIEHIVVDGVKKVFH